MIQRRQPGNVNHARVDSSSVRSIGYNEEKKELHVAFHDTGSYVYLNVPKHVYEGLMEASSKGNYLHHHIKPRFGFTKF